MPIFTSILRFLILLAILNFCETFHDGLPRRHFDYRHKNDLLDQIDIFNDEGLVQIEVPGNHYVMIDNHIYLERSYNDWNSQSKTLSPINAKTNDSSDSYAGLMETEVNLKFTSNITDEIKFLADLTVLSLEASRLHNISSETFSWLSNTSILFLNMRYTDIEAVAIDTLEPVQGSLLMLDLSHANISLIDINALLHGLHNMFDGRDSHLIALYLASMGLNHIPYKALTHVRNSLRGLSLYGNDFQTYFTFTTETYTNADSQTNESYIEDETTTNYFRSLMDKADDTSPSPWGSFPEMPLLLVLDMRKCNINYVERGSFRNLTNLKRLYLSENNILILRSFSFEGLMNLAHLDISYNDYSAEDQKIGGLIISSNSFAKLYSLEIMNLSYTKIRPSLVNQLSHLPPSLITLDLHGSRLFSLDNEIFRNLNNLQFLDISDNIGLASDISIETFKGLRMLQELYMSRTSLHSLTSLRELYSLRLLDVRRNNIASFGGVLENFPLLEHLDVSYNYLNSWRDKRAFERNSRLKGVYLHSNMLSLMSEEMLEDFESLLYLTLADNSFVCNCELKSFMDHLMAINHNSHKNLPILIDYRRNGTHVCTDVTLSKTFEFTATDKFCITDSKQYWLSVLQHVIYISMIVILSCVSAGGLIYWKWWYIRYVAILLKNATVLSVINVENCEDRVYMYDIFVSYSDQNRNWVIEELIPNIEGPEERFSICLHERDFQVGVSILDNIITGMDQSRTILLIISGCFLKSQWCQFEMHLAQHRLLETCREELVLVLLEEIPKKNRTKILRYLMMVKTYIVWPKNSEDAAEKKLFWKRLRRAITANKSKNHSVV